MILTPLLERYAQYCMKQGNNALAKYRETSSEFWYQKYLKYSKRHEKCLNLIERK